MLSDISRLVTTSLLTDSQVACSGGRDTAIELSVTITLLLRSSGAGSLLTALTGGCRNYSEVKMDHCGTSTTPSHCVG